MKIIFHSLLITLLVISCTSEPRYTVRGIIEGSDGVVFYLQKREDGKTVTLDSAKSRNGSFKIKGGEIEYPQLIQLVAGETRKRTSFYLENSKITVTGSLDSLFKAIVKGSVTQDEYQAFIDSNKPLSTAYSKIINEFQAAGQTGKSEKVAVLQRKADSIQKEMKNLQMSFIRNNPASYVTPSILSSMSYDMEAEEIESIIIAMDSLVASVPEMKSLRERVAAMKSVAVGQKAPDFTMNDVDGNKVSLSSKTGSGLLLLDFWAAWCNPCRQENPNIVKIYNEFHNKGFDVFGVSLDRNSEDWLKAIADDNLTWTQVSNIQQGVNEAAKKYAVYSIPANFLLDESGIIIARNLRGEELYNRVKTELAGKK